MRLDGAPIAVDSFSHLEAGVLFFCSHAHEDHLRGLHSGWDRGPVYCSPLTAGLLELRWPALGPLLRPLALGVVHRLAAESGEGRRDVEVMLVDANHVPGAVMFVFAGGFGTLLYTGDFRLHSDHAGLRDLPMLQSGLSRIFLDNTFCHPVFDHPAREAVVSKLLQVVAPRWPCILFVAVYSLGREPLLRDLAQRLGTRVLAPWQRIGSLTAAGMLTGEFSEEPAGPLSTSINELRRLGQRGCVWVVKKNQLRAAVEHASSSGVPAFGVQPSGWSAVNSNAARDGPIFADEAADHDAACEDGVWELPYSDHCSFAELVQFLSFLPLAPVTFITPLPTKTSGKYSYDGVEGVNVLLQQTGVPAIAYAQRATPGTRGPRGGRGEGPLRLAPWRKRLVARARRVLPCPGLRRRSNRGVYPCPGLRMRRGPVCSLRSSVTTRSTELVVSVQQVRVA